MSSTPQAPRDSAEASAASARRTVRTMKKTTARPIVSTDPIMKRIDQKKPPAWSPATPSAPVVAATAASQLGQANACAGRNQSRARRAVRVLLSFIGSAA